MLKMIVSCMAVVVLFTGVADAQTAPVTPLKKVAWEIVGMTVQAAQAATYSYYVDGASTPTPTGTVTCVAGTVSGTAACEAKLPPLTDGLHTLTVSQTINGAESPKSNVLSFTFVIVITPTNVHIALAWPVGLIVPVV